MEKRTNTDMTVGDQPNSKINTAGLNTFLIKQLELLPVQVLLLSSLPLKHQASQHNAPIMDLRASVSTVSVFERDENDNSSSSFSQMTQAFSQRISELQQLVCFRVEGA